MKGKSGPSAIGRLSAAYMIAIFGEVRRRTPLDELDALITMTISGAGLLHLVHPPVLNAVRGASRSGTSEQRGISRSAISRALHVPLETVRRRVRSLLARNVIQERIDGLSLPDTSPLGEFENSSELVALNAKIVRQLYRNLKAVGVRLE
jgi:hypothetical protein